MKLIQLLIVTLIVMLIGSGCATLTEKIKRQVSETPPSPPLSAEVKIASFTEPLKLGSEADVTVTAYSKLEGITWPNTKVSIKLPEGITLVGGDTEWIGDIEFGNPITLNARIKFTEVGNWTLTAGANYSEPGTEAGIWPTVWKCFIVTENNITIKDYACEADTYIPPPPWIKVTTTERP